LLETINGTLRDIFNFFREIFALIGIVAVHSFETPRCGFMRPPGAAQFAPL